VIGPGKDGVVYKTADFHKPWDIGVTPDPAIQAKIDDLNAQLGPILNTLIGKSSKFIPRGDQCGNTAGRTCESLVGNVVADAMRAKYVPIGVDFAITNSGGLRADLTCPTSDNGSDFCPASLYPFPAGEFPITRGQNLTVLPFGNIVVTLTVNGAELKTMLENGIGLMPAVQGRYPQVSGLCFTYDIALPAGSRVTGAVRERLHGERRRRLSVLHAPGYDPGHHGAGRGGLRHGEHAAGAGREGGSGRADQLHRRQRGRGTELSGARSVAVARTLRGPGAARAGPPSRSRRRRSRCRR